MDLKTYTELFSDCGVNVSCVEQFLGFKHYINYYKLNNHKDWMMLDRAKKRIIKYMGCSEFYGELKGDADFALILRFRRRNGTRLNTRIHQSTQNQKAEIL